MAITHGADGNGSTVLCFITETAVEGRHGGFELLFEDIDKGEIGSGAERVVVGLGRDPAADGFGVATVAAAGAFDAEFQRGQHGDRAIDRPAQSRPRRGWRSPESRNHPPAVRPRRRNRLDGGMHQRIEIGQRRPVGEDHPGQTARSSAPPR